MSRYAVIWILSVFIILVQFQNCGDVEFNSGDPSLTKLEDQEVELTENDETDEVDKDVEPPPEGTNSNNSTPRNCPAGYAEYNGKCVSTSFSECAKFVELNVTEIPTLAESGVCYYKKILNSIDVHDSGSNGEVRASNVLARNHDSTLWNPIAPYVIGDTTLKLIFKDERSITLTGSKVADLAEMETAKIKIDNFILVEMTDGVNPKRMLARGTKDSLPYINQFKNIGNIKVGNMEVTDFISYKDWGLAEVPAIDISQDIFVNLETTLRVRMLDCGGSAEASDMYLIIH